MRDEPLRQRSSEKKSFEFRISDICTISIRFVSYVNRTWIGYQILEGNSDALRTVRIMTDQCSIHDFFSNVNRSCFELLESWPICVRYMTFFPMCFFQLSDVRTSFDLRSIHNVISYVFLLTFGRLNYSQLAFDSWRYFSCVSTKLHKMFEKY